VLETKLRNHTKNEVEKARKDLERQLNEEREERKRLEEKVADLSAKLEAFMAQAGQQ
jgi:chromosome segregation ATPase